jgi:hypothetical protein
VITGELEVDVDSWRGFVSVSRGENDSEDRVLLLKKV